jgi:uncharacterized protein YndB with AHSA1/START domain
VRTALSIVIDAPIEQVFDFFDDPSRALSFQEHSSSLIQRWQIIDEQPDGRRTIDLHMAQGSNTWIQTMVQEVRERPFRLAWRSAARRTTGGEPVSFLTSDRRLAEVDGRTRVDVVVTFRLAHPWRNFLAVALNALWGNQAFRIEQEHALHNVAEYLEGRGSG